MHRHTNRAVLRCAITACALAAQATVVHADASPSPAPAPVAPVPSPHAPGVCDLPGVGSVCGVVGGVLGALPNPVSALAGAAEGAFTQWLTNGAASLLREVIHAADVSVTPKLGPASVFVAQFSRMEGLAAAVALLFLLVAVGQALLRGDPAMLLSAVFIRLPLAFVVTGALVFMTSTAMAGVDQATSYLIGDQIAGTAGQGFLGGLADTYAAGPAVSGALIALCALATIVVGIILYLELAIRAAVIYLALLFLPLGLAASVWPGAGRVARRLIDLLITAILAKFVILAALWLAAGLAGQGAAGGGFGTFVIGLVVLFLAAGAPVVLLGMVSHAEHAVATMADSRRAAYVPPRKAAHVAATAARGLAGGGAAAAQGPTTAIVRGGPSSGGQGGAASHASSGPGAGPGTRIVGARGPAEAPA